MMTCGPLAGSAFLESEFRQKEGKKDGDKNPAGTRIVDDYEIIPYVLKAPDLQTGSRRPGTRGRP
jgi:hypothetical protein